MDFDHLDRNLLTIFHAIETSVKFQQLSHHDKQHVVKWCSRLSSEAGISNVYRINRNNYAKLLLTCVENGSLHSSSIFRHLPTESSLPMLNVYDHGINDKPLANQNWASVYQSFLKHVNPSSNLPIEQSGVDIYKARIDALERDVREKEAQLDELRSSYSKRILAIRNVFVEELLNERQKYAIAIKHLKRKIKLQTSDKTEAGEEASRTSQESNEATSST